MDLTAELQQRLVDSLRERPLRQHIVERYNPQDREFKNVVEYYAEHTHTFTSLYMAVKSRLYCLIRAEIESVIDKAQSVVFSELKKDDISDFIVPFR